MASPTVQFSPTYGSPTAYGGVDAPLSPLEYPRGALRGGNGSTTATVVTVLVVLAIVAAVIVVIVMCVKRNSKNSNNKGGNSGKHIPVNPLGAANSGVWQPSDVRGRVIDLDEARASKLLEGGAAYGPAVLLVYSTGCPHCVRMQEPYAAAAAKEGNVWFGRVNAAVAQGLVKKYKIGGVPSVFGVRADGKMVAGSGLGRTTDALCEFASKLAANKA